MNEQTTFEFLTQSVGNPDQDIGTSGTTEMKPRENTSPETENQRDTENCVQMQWAKDVEIQKAATLRNPLLQTARMERDLALTHIAKGTFIPYSGIKKDFVKKCTAYCH